MKNLTRLFLLAALLLWLPACDKDDDLGPDEEFNELKDFTVQLMQQWYLWNDQVPAEVDVSKFNDLQALMESMTNKAFDRWSYVTEEVAFDQYYRAGEYVGFGFSMRFDNVGNLWVTMVYPGAPADEAGFERGTQILAINGKAIAAIDNVNQELGADEEGVQASFALKMPDGTEQTVTATKAVVNIKSVIERTVVEHAGMKVGYLMFNHFIEKSDAELDTAFAYFQAEGIDELVVDLRYNGGGMLNIANKLTSVIAPESANGQLMLEFDHNPDRQGENDQILIEALAPDFGLDRVVFITTGASASASEAVINSLEPHMQVVTIGQNSYGKPVGSYGFRQGGYVFSPITFRLSNADGNANYFDGLPVDSGIPDDIAHGFGDPEELCFQEALYFLETGGFTSAGARIASQQADRRNEELYQGFRREIGAF